MAPVIENDALVEMTYVVRDDSGSVLDSTEGAAPFTYVHGRRQLPPALEHALAGMRPGEEKDLTLGPDQAYGPVDPTAFTVVAKDALPADALVPGIGLTARRTSGETMFVTVEEVRDDTVVLNLNHPYAGKVVHLHLRVLSIVPDPS
jgi:FKBP-type peptidyl-prolyl cis-trans isomerase SlyD